MLLLHVGVKILPLNPRVLLDCRWMKREEPSQGGGNPNVWAYSYSKQTAISVF